MCPDINSTEVMRKAEALCSGRGRRLTPLRRRVLELVFTSGKPIGAYHLLEQLRSDGFSNTPPTIYRTLDFLLAEGLVHRLAKSNRYTVCAHPGNSHTGLMFVCTSCGGAAELEERELLENLGRCAGRHDFRMPDQILEVEGTCKECLTDS